MLHPWTSIFLSNKRAISVFISTIDGLENPGAMKSNTCLNLQNFPGRAEDQALFPARALGSDTFFYSPKCQKTVLFALWCFFTLQLHWTQDRNTVCARRAIPCKTRKQHHRPRVNLESELEWNHSKKPIAWNLIQQQKSKEKDGWS